MHERMMGCLKQYLEETTPEHFMALRCAAADLPGYRPYAPDPSQAASLVGQEKFKEALDFIRSVMKDWMLNPGMHVMAHIATEHLGMSKEAEIEGQLAQLMIHGILSTGDGTVEHPYRVLYIADEYDVLNSLQKRSKAQSLVSGPDGACDLQACEDGSSIYFDISIPVATLSEPDAPAP